MAKQIAIKDLKSGQQGYLIVDPSKFEGEDTLIIERDASGELLVKDVDLVGDTCEFHWIEDRVSEDDLVWLEFPEHLYNDELEVI